jgi:hypothetical protein
MGSYIAIHHKIIFDGRIPWDAYFSFDNKSIVMTAEVLRDIPSPIIFLTGSENWLYFSPTEKWMEISVSL